MTNAMLVSPPKFKPGPVDGGDLEHAFSVFYRDVLARLDPRYPNNDFNNGIVATAANRGVTLGNTAIPIGRTVPVVTLTGKIANNGQAADQRFLPQVSAGNKLSVQSILPLAATANASTATITISPHTLQYGYGQSAYSAGTISGLTPNTNYYIYADDPTYAGGAVSYLATINPQTITANNGRYYVGSILTAIAATQENITAAASTNPVSFTTASAHGWSTNDQVIFAALPGDFAVLNGGTYPITVTGNQTFTISIDGHLFASYTTGGTATRVSSGTTGAGGGGGGGGHLP